jgi:signal transduction histidine kinase
LLAKARASEAAALDRAAELERANLALQAGVDASERIDSTDDFVLETLRACAETFAVAHCSYYDQEESTFFLRRWMVDGVIYQPEELVAKDPARWRGLSSMEAGFTVGDRYLGEPVARRTRSVVLDHASGTSEPTLDRHVLATPGCAIGLNVPLFAAGKAIGALVLYRPEGASFSAAEIAKAEALGRQLTFARSAARLADREREAALVRERERHSRQRIEELRLANEALRTSISRLADRFEMNAFTEDVLRVINRHTGSMSACVFRLLPDGAHLRLSAYAAGDRIIDVAREPGFEHWREPVPTNLTPAWAKISAGEQLWGEFGAEPPDEAWPASVRFHHRMGHRMVACLPMLVGKRAVGFIGLGFRTYAKPSPERMDLARSLADQTTLALEFARLAEDGNRAALALDREHAARSRAEELARVNDALCDALSSLAHGFSVRAILGPLLRCIETQLAAVGAAVFLHNPADRTLRLRWATAHGEFVDPDEDPRLELWRRDIPDDLDSRWQNLLAQPDRIFELQDGSDGCWAFAAEWHRRLGHRSRINALLRVGDRPIGFLGVAFDRDEHGATPATLELVRALLHPATLAIELARLSDEASRVAVLEERNHLAREIHDGLAQRFTALLMQTQALRLENLDHPRLAERLRKIEDLAREGLRETRRSVSTLRHSSGEYEDLAGNLRRLVEQSTAGTMLGLTFELQGEARPVPADIGLHLLRIGQELVSNALRHARARTLTLRLAFDPLEVRLRVEDDGVGFEPALAERSGGFGLASLRQRAERIGAEWRLESRPGQGTRASVRIECPPATASLA